MNVLVIEDENRTAQLLKGMIETHPDYLVVNMCQSITNSTSYLQKHQNKLDLIFMDIQLADGESFEIFNQIEVTKPVIFCTAFNDFLLKAFQNNGIYYILKPFQQKDINEALNKVNLLTKAYPEELNTKLDQIKQPSFHTSFIVQQKEKMIPILVSSIAFIFIEHDVVYALTQKNEKVAIFKSLDDIEKAINPKDFFRINRQMIINRFAIKAIEPYFNRKVIVRLTVNNKDKAIVSRLKVTSFKKWLEKPE